MTGKTAAAFMILCFLTGIAGCGVSAPQPAGTTDPLPPRPSEIRVDGLNPCTLASPDVLRNAGVPDDPKTAPSKVVGVRGCGWSRTVLQRPSGQLSVSLATNQDVRNALSVDGSETTTVAGFGAVEIPNDWAGPQFSCDVRVDVAPAQGLWVSYYNTLGDEPGATHELMCQRAHTAAETIMRDLLARTK